MNKYQMLSIIIVISFLVTFAAIVIDKEIFESKQDGNFDLIQEGNSNVELNLFIKKGDCGDCNDSEMRIYNDIIPNYKTITIKFYKVDLVEYKINFDIWKVYKFATTPSLVIKNTTISPKNDSLLTYSQIMDTNKTLEKEIEKHLQGNYTGLSSGDTYHVPIDTPFGKINSSELTLPVLTVVLGALDSVNPCSFFVLLFLLSILLYTKSRKRMILIGGIFVFFSGFIYFLLMVAIHNVIQFIEQQLIIAAFAGAIAIIFGALNIKDYFFFKKGLSASIPESQKPKLYKQMRKLVKITAIPSLISGTIVLAISANTVELLCSFNLPLIYTSILSNYSLSGFEYYMYIFFYNIIYIIPLLIIVAAVVITLGKWKLSELQGRMLKLFSGIMILCLGEVLLLNPGMLSSFSIAIIILLLSLALTFIIYIISKITNKNESSNKTSK